MYVWFARGRRRACGVPLHALGPLLSPGRGQWWEPTKRKRSKWTDADDAALRSAFESQRGGTWEDISNAVTWPSGSVVAGATGEQCRTRWTTLGKLKQLKAQ